MVRRRTDAPSWERRTVIPLSYPGASQKQSSGRDSRRSPRRQALPRNILWGSHPSVGLLFTKGIKNWFSYADSGAIRLAKYHRLPAGQSFPGL